MGSLGLNDSGHASWHGFVKGFDVLGGDLSSDPSGDFFKTIFETLLLAIFGEILALKPPQGFKKTAKKLLVSLKLPNESDHTKIYPGWFQRNS